MSANTKIEWADHTFNPWEGCQKAGPGCDGCYAEARNKRFGGGVAINWGPGAPRRRTSVSNWRQPVAWNAGADAFEREHGRRQRVFCASLADVFDNAVDPQWRADLFELIAKTPRLDWLLTTKRIGNVRSMVPPAWLEPGAWPTNVRIIITVVNQSEADRDIPKLMALECPNGLSMEPLLGAVDLRRHFWQDMNGNIQPQRNHTPRLDWVICGGESGPKARPMHPDWARSLRDQCAAAGVPFLFKQWGEWYAEGQIMATTAKTPLYGRRLIAPDGDERYTQQSVGMHKVGKKASGRLLDGVEHNGFPS